MPDTSDTDELICRAGQGDRHATEQLVDKHRDRLRRMVAVRMDPRLVRRVDPSDIVQDVLAEAAARLPEYADQRPLPFYPWLRQLAWEQLLDVYQHHIKTQKRSVTREQSRGMELSSDSLLQLGNLLSPSQTTPSAPAMREELHQRVRAALAKLDAHDREILIMRHLEQMKVAEIASTTRHLRGCREDASAASDGTSARVARARAGTRLTMPDLHSPSQHDTDPREQLADVLEEITERIEAGHSVDLAQYQRQYPELADQLQKLVPAVSVLEGLGRSASQRVK